MTNIEVKFALRGLPKGPTTLRAHALELNQKIKLPIDLESDKNDMEIRLQAISLCQTNHGSFLPAVTSAFILKADCIKHSSKVIPGEEALESHPLTIGARK